MLSNSPKLLDFILGPTIGGRPGFKSNEVVTLFNNFGVLNFMLKMFAQHCLGSEICQDCFFFF